MKKKVILLFIVISLQANAQYSNPNPYQPTGQPQSLHSTDPYAPFSSAVPSDASTPSSGMITPHIDNSHYVESARAYFQSSNYRGNQWWTAPWTSFTGWMVNQFYNGYNQQDLDRMRTYVEDPYFQTMFDQINGNKHDDNLWNEFFNELQYGHPGNTITGNNPNNMVNPNVPTGSTYCLMLFLLPYSFVVSRRIYNTKTVA